MLSHYFPLPSEIGQHIVVASCKFSFVKPFFFMLLMQSFCNSGHRSQHFHRNNLSSSHCATVVSTIIASQ